jgi:hypothetical protein
VAPGAPGAPGASGPSGASGSDAKALAGLPRDPFRANSVRPRRRRRCDAGTPEARARLATARAAQDPEAMKKHPWRRSLSKVEALLSPEHRLEYEQLYRERPMTLAQAKQWFDQHGYPDIGMTAIQNHRRQFEDAIRELREVAKFAANVRHLFGKHGATALSDVSLTRMQLVLTERLFRDGPTGALDLEVEQLAQLSKMVASAIGARQRLEQVRRDVEAVCKLVEHESKRGTDSRLVVERVKQLLNVPLGPETPEEAAAAQRHYVPFDLAELENPAEKTDSDAKT